MSKNKILKFTEETLIDSKAKTINDYSLFAPKSKRSIKDDYPELRDAEEFRGLTKSDMLFVWYYACEASPLMSIDSDQKRVESAIKYIERIDPELITAKFKDYAQLIFTPKMEVAIHKMRQYKMGTRIRAKKMIDKTMDNYEKILSLDIDGSEFINKDGEKDFTKIKQYVDSSKTIIGNIPTLIEQAERGFSVVDLSGEDDEEEGYGLIDDYFEDK